MRTQITLLTDYRDCEIGPNVDFCDVRPSGRTVFWREEDSSTIWMAFVPEEHYSEQDFVLESLQGERLPEEYHRLRYDETSQWTVVEGPLRENQYVKVWRLTGYTPGEEERFWPSNEAREEIMIHEQLKLRPHPNIVKYHGVLVENGYVVGIVLDKLDIDLQTAVSEPTKPSHAWTVERVMKDVKEGLEHLHSIGIMHGDVYPSNIWLDHNGRAVLIDLDSAFRIGGPRYGKVVSGPFIDIHEKFFRLEPNGDRDPYACAELDFECLARTEIELVKISERRKDFE